MSNIKYTQEEACNFFKQHNLILKDIYINNKTYMKCEDLDGYKYYKTLNDIISNKNPSKFNPHNPYSIDNIKLFLKLSNLELQLLDIKYKNSNYKMLWKCECGKEFFTSWNCVLNGKKYCNFCAKSKRFDNFKDYTLEIKKMCEERDYTLLSSYIHRSTDKFEYICNKHKSSGIKTATYDSMLNLHKGCSECGAISGGIKRRTEESKLKKLTESKGFIYAGYDYDNENKKDKKVNIHIICPKHIDKGIQTVKYNNLLKSNGNCAYCIGRHRTKEDLQKELNELHGNITIINYIDYSSPIKVKCNICGSEWKTRGVNLTQGHGCPNCATSKFELDVEKVLDKWKLSKTIQYRYNDCRDIIPLPFDFYLNEYNILIEVDGEGHYMPIRRGSMTDNDAENQLRKIQYHDKIKTEYCESNHIILIRIPYWERDDIEYYLFNKLLKYNIIKNIVA